MPHRIAREKKPTLARRAWRKTSVSETILLPTPTPSKPASELAKCPTCDYGQCAPGTSCTACLDAHQQSQEARTRASKHELIGRLAGLIECRPIELHGALLAFLADGTAEIAGAVIDERGSA